MVRAASSRWGLALAAAIFVAVQACAIAVDFGTPVGIVLAIVGIWTMGTRTKWEGEVSAYSVCNKDGKAILGGFTAEQFDAQMRHKDVDDVDDADAGGGRGEHRENDGRRPERGAARRPRRRALDRRAPPKSARRRARAPVQRGRPGSISGVNKAVGIVSHEKRGLRTGPRRVYFSDRARAL